MSDPFLLVALQISVLLGIGALTFWYVLCGFSALITYVISNVLHHLHQAGRHYQHTEVTNGVLASSYHKVKVAYK